MHLPGTSNRLEMGVFLCVLGGSNLLIPSLRDATELRT